MEHRCGPGASSSRLNDGIVHHMTVDKTGGSSLKYANQLTSL